MKNHIYLVIYCLLALSSVSIKTAFDNDGQELIAILNSMLKQNSLPETQQISKCPDDK